MAFWFYIVATVNAAVDTFASTNVQQDLKFGWMLENNCGPRPSGPRYPSPPEDGHGIPHEVIPCDIIRDSKYVAGYKCPSQCQMDESMTVTLYCNCHTQIGPLQFIKDCEWEFVDGEACPPVPENGSHYDWECNPKWSTCLDGQYNLADMQNDYVLPSEEYEEYEEQPTTTATVVLTTTTTTHVPFTQGPKSKSKQRSTRPQTSLSALLEEYDGLAFDKQNRKSHQTKPIHVDLGDEIVQKMNTDDIETRYYMNGYGEDDIKNVADVKTSTGTNGNPSITNIIDFRPVFSRLFDGGYGPPREAEQPEDPVRAIRTIRKSARLNRKSNNERSLIRSDYPETSDNLQYATFEPYNQLKSASSLPSAADLGIPIRNHRQSDTTNETTDPDISAGGHHWSKKQLVESRSNAKGQPVVVAVQASASLSLQQKLARMIAIRNTLKHEKKSLELKITTIMKYVADNANTKDKVALYQELSAIDEEIATEKRH